MKSQQASSMGPVHIFPLCKSQRFVEKRVPFMPSKVSVLKKEGSFFIEKVSEKGLF